MLLMRANADDDDDENLPIDNMDAVMNFMTPCLVRFQRSEVHVFGGFDSTSCA